EEIFGPVLSFETFANEAEAIARANATIYGLDAAVFHKDVDRDQRDAHAHAAGTVWINTWGLVNDAFEEGGFKYSGIGRARGLRAMEEFQEVKTQICAVKALGGSSPHSGTMAPYLSQEKLDDCSQSAQTRHTACPGTLAQN